MPFACRRGVHREREAGHPDRATQAARIRGAAIVRRGAVGRGRLAVRCLRGHVGHVAHVRAIGHGVRHRGNRCDDRGHRLRGRVRAATLRRQAQDRAGDQGDGKQQAPGEGEGERHADSL
jgi:hypothetical protein